MLREGTTAPDFALSGLGPPDERGERQFDEFRLSEVADAPTLLVFYPGDFSPVCTDELCSLRDIDLSDGHESDRVYAVSRDSLFTHEAFAYEHDLRFPLLSDVDGEVCRAYDAVHETDVGDGVEAGLAKRSLYVLGTDLTIEYAWQSEDPYIEPDLREAVDALRDAA
jgi:peroxiredoxin